MKVADVSEAVRQYADAVMLSAESAIGVYPQKALSVLRAASERMESWSREENMQKRLPQHPLAIALPDQISEQICNCAVEMGNVVFCSDTSYASHCSPKLTHLYLFCSKQPCCGRNLCLHKARSHGITSIVQPAKPSHFCIH
jgi:pyruvate kinase